MQVQTEPVGDAYLRKAETIAGETDSLRRVLSDASASELALAYQRLEDSGP